MIYYTFDQCFLGGIAAGPRPWVPLPIVLGPRNVASCCIKMVTGHLPASDEERNVTSFCSVSVVVIEQKLRIPCSISVLIDLSMFSFSLSQAEIATVGGHR